MCSSFPRIQLAGLDLRLLCSSLGICKLKVACRCKAGHFVCWPCGIPHQVAERCCGMSPKHENVMQIIFSKNVPDPWRDAISCLNALNNFMVDHFNVVQNECLKGCNYLCRHTVRTRWASSLLIQIIYSSAFGNFTVKLNSTYRLCVYSSCCDCAIMSQ